MKNTFYTLWTICLIIAMLYMWKVFLIPLTLSIFFWLIMSYQVQLLQNRTSRKVSTYIVIAGYICVLGACIYGIWSSAGYINDNISSLTTQIQESYETYEDKVQSYSFVSGQDISNRKDQVKEWLSIDLLGGIASGTLSGMTTMLLIMVLSILMLIYEDRILYTIKSRYGKDGVDVVYISRTTVAQYCLWLMLLIFILFVLNSIGLLVFGVSYALLIAAISAIATLVPTIGTLIGGVFATLVWWFLTWSLWVWLGIMAWYLVIQQIEEFFIMPKVVWSRVSLNTMASITSLFVWGLLWGVAWLFLAIPIMGVLQKIGDKHKKSYAVLMWNDGFKN